MMNLDEEKKLWTQGFSGVVGIDEAGRGPLAGPVVAAAIVIKNKDFSLLALVNDSKKLSEKKREELYALLTNHQDIAWGIGIVDEITIDKINILQATKLAMQEAVVNLVQKIDDHRFFTIDYLLIDGNFKINWNPAAFAKSYGEPKQEAIIKGDQKVFSIAAASIIAKVTRDKIMQKMHQQYPEYGFDKHKGYGTALHIAKIKELGVSKIHRQSFCKAFLKG